MRYLTDCRTRYVLPFSCSVPAKVAPHPAQCRAIKDQARSEFGIGASGVHHATSLAVFLLVRIASLRLKRLERNSDLRSRSICETLFTTEAPPSSARRPFAIAERSSMAIVIARNSENSLPVCANSRKIGKNSFRKIYRTVKIFTGEAVFTEFGLKGRDQLRSASS